MFKLDTMARPHELIFVDEAGFNLTKRRRRDRNIIDHRAIVEFPGQRGGNITLCAAISNRGVLSHHATLGPCNTEHLLTCLDGLRDVLSANEQQEHEMLARPLYVIIWHNVNFHHTVQVREWFDMNPNFINLFLPPYSPFLNAIEEFFSTWRLKVYERQPYTRLNLVEAMELACDDIGKEMCQAWVRHTRVFFPSCLARTNITCDVDEALWPGPALRQDEAQ